MYCEARGQVREQVGALDPGTRIWSGSGTGLRCKGSESVRLGLSVRARGVRGDRERSPRGHEGARGGNGTRAVGGGAVRLEEEP